MEDTFFYILLALWLTKSIQVIDIFP